MSDSLWFEEKPSKDLIARIERAADQEFDRRIRVAQGTKADSRRGLLSLFSFEVLSAVSVAGIAGILGFWLTHENHDRVQLEASDDSELMDDSLEADDIQLVADIEFLEDYDILESLKDEELSV